MRGLNCIVLYHPVSSMYSKILGCRSTTVGSYSRVQRVEGQKKQVRRCPRGVGYGDKALLESNRDSVVFFFSRSLQVSVEDSKRNKENLCWR